MKVRQAGNSCKKVLEAAKLTYANKTEDSFTSQKLGSRGFWRIANSVLSKGKSAIPRLFNGPEVVLSASHKANCFSKNFNFNDSGFSLPAIPKLIKKVITNLDLSKAFRLDRIPEVVLKKCEPDLSYILANRRLRKVLDGKSSQEYPVNAGVHESSFSGPTLFLLYVEDPPDDVICNIAIYGDDTALYSKCH